MACSMHGQAGSGRSNAAARGGLPAAQVSSIKCCQRAASCQHHLLLHLELLPWLPAPRAVRFSI